MDSTRTTCNPAAGRYREENGEGYPEFLEQYNGEAHRTIAFTPLVCTGADKSIARSDVNNYPDYEGLIPRRITRVVWAAAGAFRFVTIVSPAQNRS